MSKIDELKARAEKGDAGSQSDLGIAYAIGDGAEPDLQQAVYWFRTAADQGNAGAQYNLGGCFATGEGVEQNLTEAARYYELAAEQGLPDSAYCLATCHARGLGAPQDWTLAAKWMKFAKDKGHPGELEDPFEEYQIGNCFALGGSPSTPFPDHSYRHVAGAYTTR
ncbi:hypothetical protein CYMTET_10225 [Cymbomonas tetramitiformis]|uniref:Sel1 repeat family protein n=1 Tax=Cymbomonas tetramitiformis TaxID=36881 RepID=A0AAE0LE85_9CHLO|nr:hypothetical protein CYMTET_10225 [Cymbomonas tetramitiformis]